jgi:FAD/FMN-containing dehydrogenase
VNYGHPLEFGTVIAPTGASADAPVALARRSEEVGLDLVTLQDHPYRPELLDALTLLAWVAGRTERIRLAANVVNLPLRSPAVLARSAASLDLLSGGRLELALGAGASWDAIEAMGGRRLSSAESVDALSEGIDIIRGVLDAGESRPIQYAGDHYRVGPVQRGPLPRHRMPIWVGGRGEELLGLIGEKADGWVATVGAELSLSDIRTANKIIDEAAPTVGREPADVRRLVNVSGRFASASRGGFLDGPSEQWVEQLLPLVVEDGLGTFLLASDDLPTIERFAEEVAPGLRAAVDRELAAPLPVTAPRSTAVLAKRRDGIDYNGIPESLASSAVEPGDIDYPRVRSNYLRGGSPGLVLRPRSTAEVVDALAYARRHLHLPLGVRSGGHGISGRSTNDGGIVIDLGNLDSIEVIDQAARLVRVGPGARWKEVAAALEPYGWALTSGDYGGVGVGGLATAGGIGFLGRQQGLTIDHLRAVEVVLADGSVVRASDTENADLFWAIRGAGANFGIVTSFEFHVEPVGDVGWAQLVFDASDTANFLERFGQVATNAPRDTTAFLIMGPPRGGQPAVAQIMAMVASEDPGVVVDRLQPFAQLAPLLQQQVVIVPYAAVMAMASDAEHQGQGEPLSRSALVREITPSFAAGAAAMLDSGAVHFFALRTVGGAIADVDPKATAYAHRDAAFSVVAMGTSRHRLEQTWNGLRDHFDGLYLSFDSAPRPDRLAEAFPPETLARLRELKRRYDPENLFRDNFNIDPAMEIAS